ncbi:MAG: transcription termination/antitermination NusG family protein [Ginsengibacter sp.]
MQKNWYIFYTKPRMEKRVASLLTRRKIQNFVPLNSKRISSFKRIKIQQEPLFESYVFAKLQDNEMVKVRNTEGVVNFVYWKGAPANIQEDEIELIKDFTSEHENILIEKIHVNELHYAEVIDGSKYSLSGNLLTVKNTVAKVNLPSLGYSLVAHVNNVNHLEIEVPFGEKGLLLQS